ncbi:MAG: serine/threonine-protein kinase [Halioglobus sp.]
MASPSSSGSTLRRVTSNASRRLTEGLLSSSGTIATVGLVTAMLTLGFVIWFVVELQQQSRVGAPLARSAAVMNASINESLATLRGWVAYGQESSRTERSRVWSLQIEPTLENLENLAQKSGDTSISDQVTELRGQLRDLKIIQWAIEDVANTPGNRPAQVAYETRLRPLQTAILKGLHSAIEQYSDTESGERAIGFVAQLARFRSAFTQADLALSNYVADASEIYEHNALQQLIRARELSSFIDAAMARAPAGDLRDLVTYTLGEFHAYDLQVNEIVTMQKATDWNVAQFLYIHEAQPVVIRALALAGDMAKNQARAMEERSETLTKASYIVTAMALLMGFLSAGSLLFSVRLKHQVYTVLEKARTLGQYEIDRRIGSGGMGEVYLGHHAMLRKPTAIKLLNADSAMDVRAQNRFQREINLACQLTHPNTIEIFDYGRTPAGIFYYAMEYLDGFSVDAMVTVAGPVAPGRVIHILIQACGSLHEAHQLGFLHRDVKPANMMLTTAGGICDTLKILDFGLVRDLTDDSDEEEIAGTPMYLAPESVLTTQSGSPRSDLYALGAVGYFMLTGTTIFPDSDVATLLAQQIESSIPFPSQRLGRALPEDLEYVIMACLSKDPALRPDSAAHLAKLLEDCNHQPWTAVDAQQWWATWGETAKREAAPGDDMSSPSVDIIVDESRL